MRSAIGTSLLTLSVGALGLLAAENELENAARQALAKATRFLHTKLAVHGTYLWSYSTDLQQRRGELPATPTQGWVQPPGTPSVGLALLRAYLATGDKIHLQAALAAAHALADTQLASGGWDYYVDFEPEQHRRWFYRKDVEAGQKAAGQRRNTTTFDDDNTQSALRFLMEVDRVLEGRDAKIRRAVEYGLSKLLEAQYPNGAWPQQYSGRLPAIPNPNAQARFPKDWPRVHPGRGYRYAHFYTLNDRAMETIIDTLLQAHRLYGRQEYLQAARKGGEFLLCAQLPEPQPVWAQQYNFDMEPAWARVFEPPAVASAESASAVFALLELYLATGDERFFRPIPKAISWFQKARLPNGDWARFYELQTNRPLYFDKRYRLAYSDDDLPPIGYWFKGPFGRGVLATYERLSRLGREQFLAERAERTQPTTAKGLRARLDRLRPQVREIVQSQDAEGRWLENNEIRTSVFVRNMETLAEYLRCSADWKKFSQHGQPRHAR